MMKKQKTILILALATASLASAAVFDDATYAHYFDRAAALIPGMTILEENLSAAEVWEITGGQLTATNGTLRLKAESDTVELVWKGHFTSKHVVQLESEIRALSAAEMQSYVFTDERFNRIGDPVQLKAAADTPFKANIYSPPRRRYGDISQQQFDGFKLEFTGDGLAGNILILRAPSLKTQFFEGCFRYVLDVPEGAIWEAAAEIADSNELFINGQVIEDESIILQRPSSKGQNYYKTRRVGLKKYLKPGRNILGLSVKRTGNAPAAYLLGAVVMESGERIPFDSGTNWVWQSEVPDNWAMPDYDASDWLEILNQDAVPVANGRGAYHRGLSAVATTMTTYGFSYQPRGRIPAYDGLIKLRNPSDKKFYFNENNPFRLTVLLPPGLQSQNPTLKWEINRYAADGTFSKAAQGVVQNFRPAEGSLLGAINTDSLARSIYVFTSRLLLNDEVVEERDPELMVVTGKVPMKDVAGESWEEGLNLKLEKVIDFTNPDDPHPWFETDNKGPIPPKSGKWGTNYYHTVEPALIIERNGLKYRETRPVNRAQFSYLVEFAHPGDWYLMVLEYPDDAERWISVSCNADRIHDYLKRRDGPEQFSACSKCGPGIWTGGKYPNSGKILEMKWIYRPDPGSHAVNVMSLMKNTAAAAIRLRIYHISGPLTAVDAGSIPILEQRRFGMLTERTYPWGNGIYNLFSSLDTRFDAGSVVPLQGDRGAGQYSLNAIIDGCEHLRLLEDAASHYAEYMRFAGQNIHAMGCYQYSDANTASQWLTGDPRIHDSSGNMLARVLDANDLMFYASVEFICTERLGNQDLDPNWFFADLSGERVMNLWANKPLNLNFLHPEVETEMLELARQLAESFKHQANFLGINWTTFFSGFWIPSYRTYTYPYNDKEDPLGNGYDDLTIRLFEKDAGVKVDQQAGVKDNQDFADKCKLRYQFLTSTAMKPMWLAWRSEKMAEFFAKVNRVINEARPGLETVAGCYFNTDHAEDCYQRRVSVTDYVSLFGWSPAAFQKHENVWLMPWLPVSGEFKPGHRADNYAMSWHWNQLPEFYDTYAGLERRALMLKAGWIEVEDIAGNYPYQPGWARPYQQTMMSQQREEMAMEPYTQAMIGMDPQMFMIGFTDVSPYIGVEGMQRKLTRVLRRLPHGKFESVLRTGFSSNLAIKALPQENDLLFYVVNPGYWPITGTIRLENAKSAEDLVSGKSLALHDGIITIELEPFGIAAFRVVGRTSAPPTIADWENAPVPLSELAHMRNILKDAQEALAEPNMAIFLSEADYALLRNHTAKAEESLAAGEYAAAWAALSAAPFWTVLYQTAPDVRVAEIIRRRELTASFVKPESAPQIDGILNDALWSDAVTKQVGPLVTVEKTYSAQRTLVRAATDGDRLWLAFECHDPEPDKIRGTTDPEGPKSDIWGSSDDMVIFFINPDDANYYQLAVSAGGAFFDQQNFLKDGRSTSVNYEYAPKWQVATARTAQGWTVEIEIDVMDAFGTKIAEGMEWRMNFHRQFRFKEYPAESWSFNPGSWHSLDHMGIVRFQTR